MDVFELRNQLVGGNGAFARSFTRIKSADIRDQLNEIHADDRFWPEPWLQINPNYMVGPAVADLSQSNELHLLCASIFQTSDEATGNLTPLRLHTHQFQALSAGRDFACHEKADIHPKAACLWRYVDSSGHCLVPFRPR